MERIGIDVDWHNQILLHFSFNIIVYILITYQCSPIPKRMYKRIIERIVCKPIRRIIGK